MFFKSYPSLRCPNNRLTAHTNKHARTQTHMHTHTKTGLKVVLLEKVGTVSS